MMNWKCGWLSEALTSKGHLVNVASTGIEAISKLRSDEHQLVISDIKMPKMSGLELLQEIKKDQPRLPVIMVTSYGTIENAVEAMKQGAEDYILKPFSFEVLEKVVGKVLRKAQALSEDNGTVKKITKEIIAYDPKMQNLLKLCRNIAKNRATVLLQGESGTGKELIAHYIHAHSARASSDFVAVNCASLPKELLESELFGHEKGSFTGAIARKIGKFELANRGTLLLDEISEIDLQSQAKLLRAIQEQEIDRVGGQRPIPLDVRIIATTNRELKKYVDEGQFREDLYYRINVIPIFIPPLRERIDDITPLIDYFLKKTSLENEKEVKNISQEALSFLLKREWKGNIRELENLIERAVLLAEEDCLMPEHFHCAENNEGKNLIRSGFSVKEMEKNLILKTLEEVKGNRTKAATMLEISVRTLRNKLKEYRISESDSSKEDDDNGNFSV